MDPSWVMGFWDSGIGLLKKWKQNIYGNMVYEKKTKIEQCDLE